MPIREYVCDNPECRNEFEKLSRTQADFEKAKGNTTCPICGTYASPLVSQTARPRFKGSGFYENDYRK